MRLVHGAAADATGIANIDKRAGAGFEHVGKVFRPHNEASIPIDMRLAGEISRGVGNKRRLGRIVDERGEFIGELDLGSRTKGSCDTRSSAALAN
jgi:hypothetical protein